MNQLLPTARIILRYLIGYLAGAEIGQALSMDEDLVMALALVLAALVEIGYGYAKRHGGAT